MLQSISKSLSDIQPQLFPRLHYFARALNSDVFVFRDDVQFVRNHRYPNGSRQPSYQIHTPVAGSEGERLLNSQTKAKSILPINQTEISYQPDWTKKFLNVVDECYRKAPHFSEFRDEIAGLLNAKFSTVSELNIQTTLWGFCRLLNIPYRIGMTLSEVNVQLIYVGEQVLMRKVLAGSDLLNSCKAVNNPTNNILELCKINFCDRYIAGGTALNSYFELDKFSSAKVTVCCQEWKCSEYSQISEGKVSSKSFVPNLSILDILAYLPIEIARSNLLSNFDTSTPESYGVGTT